VHDPSTGGVLGVIDITGGDDAVAPATLPLVEAAVAAVEAELRIQRLDEAAHRPPARATIPRRVPGEALLSVLGREDGRLEVGDRSIELSSRHSEILALLAWHRDGLSADRLSRLVYGQDDHLVTLRAEMVRLRRILVGLDQTLAPESRPYRLRTPVELDAHRVLAFLDKGAHRVALAAYTGRVLPTSQAPGIRAISDEVSGRLRESLLGGASADTLLAYARTDDAAYDVEVWKTVLRLLPPRSPKRAAVVSRIERIDSEVGRN